MVERLHRNQGRYGGETIDIQNVLAEMDSALRQTNWFSECFLATPKFSLRSCRRIVPHAQKRLYLSSGIHGDEPAGPLALLRLLQENQWPDNVELWICPCLNPTGFPLNRRENENGFDLNRDYRHLQTEEIRAHAAWLSRQPPFDISVVLHEDWEANGFYLYELNPRRLPSLAETIMARVSDVCPIETAPLVDNWPARHGIIRPNVNPQERPQWPESIYLISHKTQLSYTLEAPSDFPMPARVNALVAAVRAVLEHLAKPPQNQ